MSVSPVEKKAHPRSKFTPEEDEVLKSLVTRLGTNDWQTISHQMGGRNARQCRDRWQNYLCPDVVNGPWSDEEEELLVQKFQELGPSWKQIASFFPTRTDINIKSRWHLRERRIKKEELQKKKALLKQPYRRAIQTVQPQYPALLNQQLPQMQQIPQYPQYSQPMMNQQMPQQISHNYTQMAHTPMMISQSQPAVQINQTFSLTNTQNETIIPASTAKGTVQGSVINTEPLPFFSAEVQANERVDEINFAISDDAFDTMGEDCWNSLLLNDEVSSFESSFENWF
ncbi:hypothetical protein TRFO_26508 [Tritrichomonas foetus]|uniref:Myb-like DNA-binding domain containing protein n=1 Tax=Tritrichomonas foetus TaxID=1144522 RepID=A0A1J4K2L2_9EUKA|nr:hypothetical protein TRFO_26508 [Tritrichomonas foetus]|eukprot:OHT05631.1 hypothetical protein TRFO_26508 [Tritrichomonas foetus]